MAQHCYHCGVDCDDSILWNDKVFCCAGCQLVYQLLDENGLCQYYDLTDMPGMTAKGHFVSDEYNYLDNEIIQDQLIQFKQGDQAHVVFYLPQMHCVSCVWLLENLHKINPGITPAGGIWSNHQTANKAPTGSSKNTIKETTVGETLCKT